MSLVSAVLLLVTIMDPVGNVPSFVASLQHVPAERRTHVIAREMLFALALLLVFFFGGGRLMALLQLSPESLFLGGGIMLFLIAIKMIFPPAGRDAHEQPAQEPFIVPLATPLVAGPSVIATLMLLTSSQPALNARWLAALFIAWAITSAVLLCAPIIARGLREKGSMAIERLMGMLLVIIAVQMFLNGLAAYLKSLRPA
ncbi:MAG: NAAT family transporter [Pedosphaera sp.]|nr:NAAT family transporter [Pedosphaera sp.]MSU44190.1 NAAT family transporter [Pedosphaera sp.]